MVTAALIISIISLFVAGLAVLYTRRQTSIAADQLAIERARETRAEAAQAPSLSVERSGSSGGDGQTWNAIVTVHNDGGSLARQVRVEARIDGESTGQAQQRQDIPTGQSRDFNVVIYNASRFGTTEEIERMVTFYAYDADGNHATVPLGGIMAPD